MKREILNDNKPTSPEKKPFDNHNKYFNISNQTHYPLRAKGGFRNNIFGLTVLIILYTIQGIPIGFFRGSLSILLTEKGVEFKDLGLMAMIFLPFSFKFLAAPILDAFYFKKFGQRKSYVVPIQYIYSILSFILSYKMRDFIENSEVDMLFICGLLCLILIALQDVAVDGWALTILTDDYLSYGPLTNTIGLIVGGLISYNLFIHLNSVEFCNNYIFSTPHKDPLLSISGFWKLNSIIVLLMTLFVHFFVKESEIPSEESSSIKEVARIVKLFYKNENLRKVSIICLTHVIISGPINAFFESVLLQKGFHKETLTNINSFLLGIEILTSMAIAKICSHKNFELKIYLLGCGIALFIAFFQLFILWNFSVEKNFNTTLGLVVISSVISSIQREMSICVLAIFCNKISLKAVGGTVSSTRAAITNTGTTWVKSLSLYLGSYMEWSTICSIAPMIGVLYCFWCNKTVKILESKTKAEFFTSRDARYDKVKGLED